MPSEILWLNQWIHQWHYGSSELDEVVADERDLVLHALDYGVYELRVLEYALAFSLRLWWIKGALEENNFEEVEEVHLHGVVLVVDHLAEGSEDGINNQMSNLIWSFLMLLQRLQYQLHKFTGWCINCLRLLVKLIINRLNRLPHNKLQRDIHNNLQILILALKFPGASRPHPVEQLIELAQDVVRGVHSDNVVDHFFLGV